MQYRLAINIIAAIISSKIILGNPTYFKDENNLVEFINKIGNENLQDERNNFEAAKNSLKELFNKEKNSFLEQIREYKKQRCNIDVCNNFEPIINEIAEREPIIIFNDENEDPIPTAYSDYYNEVINLRKLNTEFIKEIEDHIKVIKEAKSLIRKYKKEAMDKLADYEKQINELENKFQGLNIKINEELENGWIEDMKKAIVIITERIDDLYVNLMEENKKLERNEFMIHEKDDFEYLENMLKDKKKKYKLTKEEINLQGQSKKFDINDAKKINMRIIYSEIIKIIKGKVTEEQAESLIKHNNQIMNVKGLLEFKKRDIYKTHFKNPSNEINLCIRKEKSKADKVKKILEKEAILYISEMKMVYDLLKDAIILNYATSTNDEKELTNLETKFEELEKNKNNLVAVMENIKKIKDNHSEKMNIYEEINYWLNINKINKLSKEMKDENMLVINKIKSKLMKHKDINLNNLSEENFEELINEYYKYQENKKRYSFNSERIEDQIEELKTKFNDLIDKASNYKSKCLNTSINLSREDGDSKEEFEDDLSELKRDDEPIMKSDSQMERKSKNLNEKPIKKTDLQMERKLKNLNETNLEILELQKKREENEEILKKLNEPYKFMDYVYFWGLCGGLLFQVFLILF